MNPIDNFIHRLETAEILLRGYVPTIEECDRLDQALKNLTMSITESCAFTKKKPVNTGRLEH